MKYCSYGCGKEGKFEFKNGKLCCSKSSNQCKAQRTKNSEGLQKAYTEGKKSEVFNDEHRLKSINAKKEQAVKNVLVQNSNRSNSYVRKLLVEELGIDDKVCSICDTREWQGKPLQMHLDHIDGINTNNTVSNLRFICPNCHSQTETYCGKNINNGSVKVTDKELVECLIQTPNIRQALIKANLSPKGGNYTRATKLSALVEKLGVEAVKFGETGSIATPSEATKVERVET